MPDKPYIFDRKKLHLVMYVEMPDGKIMLCIYKGADGGKATAAARNLLPDGKIVKQKMADDRHLDWLERHWVGPLNSE